MPKSFIRGAPLLAILAAFALAPAFAQPYSMIQTPPLSAIAAMASEETLHELILANLVAGNCEAEDLTRDDAALLGGTAQMIAEHMEIRADQYFPEYVHPAMEKMTDVEVCAENIGMTKDMLQSIKDLGGRVISN